MNPLSFDANFVFKEFIYLKSGYIGCKPIRPAEKVISNEIWLSIPEWTFDSVREN